MEFGRVIFEIRKRTESQTNIHPYTLITILHTPTIRKARVNVKPVTGCSTRKRIKSTMYAA